MPPRYAYWTILVDNQPTAFRAGAKEDLLPTFNRLKEKNPSAVMMWFQNGKLWPSRVDAQEAMLARGEMGRRGDARQGGGFRERHKVGPRHTTQDPRPRTQDSRPRTQDLKTSDKLDWKPKGTFTPAPKRSERPDWRPKSSFDRDRKPEWRSKTSKPQNLNTSRSSRPEWKPKGSFDRHKPEWKPKTSEPQNLKTPEKRKWIPKEQYKKSLGIEAKRDSKWRPGGAHRDPKQKYKDAKKAKWSKFKQNIRKTWVKKQGRKKDEE